MRHRALSAARALFIFLALVSSYTPACAHALLVDSTPKDGALVTLPPHEAVLRFNASIETRVSQVTLLAADGRKVPLPPAAHRQDAGPPDRLVIPLPTLKPGTYRLQYRVLATDGHATPGLIRFTISGGTPP